MAETHVVSTLMGATFEGRLTNKLLALSYLHRPYDRPFLSPNPMVSAGCSHFMYDIKEFFNRLHLLVLHFTHLHAYQSRPYLVYSLLVGAALPGIYQGTRENLGQTDLWRVSLPSELRARMLTALPLGS